MAKAKVKNIWAYQGFTVDNKPQTKHQTKTIKACQGLQFWAEERNLNLGSVLSSLKLRNPKSLDGFYHISEETGRCRKLELKPSRISQMDECVVYASITGGHRVIKVSLEVCYRGETPYNHKPVFEVVR